MYYIAATVSTFIILIIPYISEASGTKIPTELDGIWITTKVDNIQSNSGGTFLKTGEKDRLCRSLTKDISTPHNFEGVLILRGDKMITWDGSCDVFGGFKKSGDAYNSNWRCGGEHGTNRGKVVFHIVNMDGNTILTETVKFQKGGEYTNIYDDKCK
jgi:hypothetical protein